MTSKKTDDSKGRSHTKRRDDALVAAAAWGGLKENGILPVHRRAREIRNIVCQLSNRPKFSRGISGNHEECMKAMCCSILNMLMKETESPKSALATLFNIDPTRVSALLEGKHWPGKAINTRMYMLDSILWMMLGGKWKEIYKEMQVEDRNPWTIKAKVPDQEKHYQKWSKFWIVRHAEDIVDYFFPLQANVPQPYFSPTRLSWESAFDRREITLSVNWMRRMAKANQHKAYIAFFVPTPATARALFDEQYILPAISWAARESPDRLKIHVFNLISGNEAEDSAAEIIYQQLEELMKKVADGEEAQRNRPRGVTGKHVGNVEFISENRNEKLEKQEKMGEKGLPTPRALRSILSFMFRSYTVEEAGENIYREHLSILRPYCMNDSATPFCVDVNDYERNEFLLAARERYRRFDEIMGDLRYGKNTFNPQEGLRKR